MKKIFSVLEEVKDFLTKHPALRDSDERLMANIWGKYLGDPSYVNGDDILIMLAKKELPSYESISRCRRKIQQSTPYLRGEKWEKRHKRSKKIRKEITA